MATRFGQCMQPFCEKQCNSETPLSQWTSSRISEPCDTGNGDCIPNCSVLFVSHVSFARKRPGVCVPVRFAGAFVAGRENPGRSDLKQ